MLKRREQVSVPLDAELQADLSAREAALVQAQIQLNVASEAVIAREAAVGARELAADTREADLAKREVDLGSGFPGCRAAGHPGGSAGAGCAGGLLYGFGVTKTRRTIGRCGGEATQQQRPIFIGWGLIFCRAQPFIEAVQYCSTALGISPV